MSRKKDPVTRYAERILAAGTDLAGPYVRGACERHLRDMERHGEDLWFDAETALAAIQFFSDILMLAGGDDEGKPFVLLGWQEFVVGSAYGWFIETPDEGWQRRFRVLYVETGKGSGKTPLIAGTGIKSICADDEPRAECYVLARTKEQTEVTFNAATAMIEQSPYLRDRLLVSGGRKPTNIAHVDSGSWMARVSSDSMGKGKSGPIPHAVICDEYHEHDTDNMLEFYRAGTKKRKKPLTLIITNAGIASTSPCGREHAYAVGVALGEKDDDRYFAYVCALDEGDDPYDPEQEACWIKTNPSLPATPTVTYIREEVRKAIGMPSKRSKVDRLQFCRWVDAESPWIDRDRWIACERQPKDCPTREELMDCPMYLSFDASKNTDLTAAGQVWKLPGDRLFGRAEAWAPKDGLQQRGNRDGVPYEQWEAEGYLNTTPGNFIDLAFVAYWVKQQMDLWPNLVGLAFDPQKMDYLEKELSDLGVYHSRDRQSGYLYLIGHSQSMRAGSDQVKAADENRLWRPRLFMPRSIDDFEGAILDEAIGIEYSPLTRTAALAGIVVMDPLENRRFDKNKAVARIDPLVALTMAVGFARAKHLGKEGSAMVKGLYD